MCNWLEAAQKDACDCSYFCSCTLSAVVVAEAVTTVVVIRYHCLSSSQPTVIILFRTVRPG